MKEVIQQIIKEITDLYLNDEIKTEKYLRIINLLKILNNE